ncbi:MAG: hypothetical protein J2P36_19325 [Ktedonobacteraceae bacterium]|nr:hypothetical protein [Ktedonobacteraceae bacterium]
MMLHHFITLKDRKNRRQIVGDGGLPWPKGEFVDGKMTFSRQVSNPDSAIP